MEKKEKNTAEVWDHSYVRVDPCREARFYNSADARLPCSREQNTTAVKPSVAVPLRSTITVNEDVSLLRCISS